MAPLLAQTRDARPAGASLPPAQAELFTAGGPSLAQAASVALLGLEAPAGMLGLVVDLGEDRPLLVLKWARRQPLLAGLPAALTARDDCAPAEILLDGQRCGQAGIREVLEAAMVPGDGGRTSGVTRFRDALRQALAVRGCLDQEAACRATLARALAGQAFGLLKTLAEQSLWSLVSPQVEWALALRRFDQFSHAGMAGCAGFALRPRCRLPSPTLARRLEHVGSPLVTGAFVRTAMAIEDPHERGLFEQALQRLLKGLHRAARAGAVAPAAPSLRQASLLAIVVAQRSGMLGAMRATGARFDADSVLSRLALGEKPAAGQSRPTESAAAAAAAVRVTVLHAWARRMEHEVLGLAWPAPDIRALIAQGNEVLEGAVLGMWSCQALQTMAWAELSAPDWAEESPVGLPETSWPCEVPAGAAERLAGAGIAVEPIGDTTRLRAEARQMRNCLASSPHYVSELQSGRSRIYALSGALRLTLEMQRDDSGSWFLAQARGVSNALHEQDCHDPPDTRWEAVRDFVTLVCEGQPGRDP